MTAEWPPYGGPDYDRLDSARVLRHLGLRGEVHPSDVFVFLYADRADAEEAARLNRDGYGYDVWPLIETEAGWVEVVNLRPHLARLGGAATDPARPDRGLVS